MEHLKFKVALMNICKGFVQLAWSCKIIVKTHKWQSAFIISFAFNIALLFAVGNAHAERDHCTKQAYIMEQKVDSLKIILGNGMD